MTSREQILTSIKANKPELTELAEVQIPVSHDRLAEKFTDIAVGIGAKVYQVQGIAEIKDILNSQFSKDRRFVSTLSEFGDMAETDISRTNPHSLANVELAIIKAEIAVAENSALWVPECNVPQRVLPFICQHLAILVERETLVPTMHQAYEMINTQDYGYGVFIAGPSKTADIEQSLVLGAHGPRSLSVFILE